MEDVIALTGNITFVRAADAISTNVTNGKTMALVGGGSTLSGGGLARVLDVNASGEGQKVAIDSQTMTSGRVILRDGAGIGVIGEDAQRADIQVGNALPRWSIE